MHWKEFNVCHSNTHTHTHTRRSMLDVFFIHLLMIYWRWQLHQSKHTLKWTPSGKSEKKLPSLWSILKKKTSPLNLIEKRSWWFINNWQVFHLHRKLSCWLFTTQSHEENVQKQKRFLWADIAEMFISSLLWIACEAPMLTWRSPRGLKDCIWIATLTKKKNPIRINRLHLMAWSIKVFFQISRSMQWYSSTKLFMTQS